MSKELQKFHRGRNIKTLRPLIMNCTHQKEKSLLLGEDYSILIKHNNTSLKSPMEMSTEEEVLFS